MQRNRKKGSCQNFLIVFIASVRVCVCVCGKSVQSGVKVELKLTAGKKLDWMASHPHQALSFTLTPCLLDVRRSQRWRMEEDL